MSSWSSETVPFWAAASLVRESNAPQGCVISMDGMESWTGKLTGVESDSTASGTPFQRGDVLFGKLRPYLAKSWLADESGTAQGDIHVYRPHAGTHPEYLAYIIRSREFVRFANAASEGVKMPRVEWPKLRSYDIPLPGLPSQRRIADYLDRETAQIDAMAGALDGLVARLEERRRAILGRAVRDEEGRFTLANVQAITTINSGDAIEASEIDQSGEYPVYGGNGVRGFTHRFNQTESRVLIGRQGALCGNVHIACAPFWASEHALVLTPHRKTDIRWLAYTLDDQGLGALSMSAAQPGITASGVGRQKIPLPPLDEQRRIADYLDAETAKIDAMIAKAGELRALLDERRSALITATVTGQHPVPEEP